MTTIQDQIIKVTDEIEEVEQQIVAVERELREGALSEDEKNHNREEVTQLRGEKKRGGNKTYSREP
jgi:hypothetical protein